MNTTNAAVQSVPGFGQKWWNALVKFFKRDGTCACPSGKLSTPKVEQAQVTEARRHNRIEGTEARSAVVGGLFRLI
jgi:hypothetical protein